jgi:hypothetical protein
LDFETRFKLGIDSKFRTSVNIRPFWMCEISAYVDDYLTESEARVVKFVLCHIHDATINMNVAG